MPRLFLSFSVEPHGDDRHFIRLLFERIRQQGIDAWIFESPRGEIASGNSISLECRRKIAESDLFVVLISDRALKSDYVEMEVSHALWEYGNRSLPILPLIATQEGRHAWPPSFVEVSDFKGIPLSRPMAETLESVIPHICRALHIDYVPPLPESPRLPLRKRVSEELQASSGASGYAVGDFIAVLRKCDHAVEAMADEEYSKARRLLETILTDLEYVHGLQRPYYARIAYGAALMAEAQAGLRSFLEVEKHYTTIIEERDTKVDANAFGGRANARMALGRFAEALTDYQTAEGYLESPDSALLYNMIRARALGALGMDRAEIYRRRSALEAGLVTRIPGDLARLTASISLAFAYTGDVQEALRAWRDVGDLDAVFPELVADIGDQLQRHAANRGLSSSLDAAEQILSQYLSYRLDLSVLQGLQVQHLRARVMFDRGDHRRARQQLAALIQQFPRSPVLHLDAAMFALADGDALEARRLCLVVTGLTDAAECLPSLSPPEFNFALGQAFWLMGRRPEAQESFRRSGYDRALSYEVSLRREFGRAA